LICEDSQIMHQREDWVEVEVRAVRDLTPTVREFRLAYPLPVSASPGAHVNIDVGGSFGSRSYSVVEADHQGILTIAVKLLEHSRGGSRYMWSLQPGARVRATAPRSAFELTHSAPSYLLVAGGIGVTPLVAMARALRRKGSDVRMLYAARNRDELAYGPELSQLLGHALQCFPDGGDAVLDLKAEIASLPHDGELYMCGPIGLMEAIRSEWVSQARPLSRLRFESFGSSGTLAEQAFTVAIPRLGLEVRVPQDSSMLDALLNAGVGVLSECRRGECGLCALDVVSTDAEIDHRDVFFSGEQHRRNQKMCACVSRVAGGTVVVDTAWRGDPDLGKTDTCLADDALPIAG